MEVKQLGESNSKARDSEVPRAATAQPHEPQPTRQEGERTTDTDSTATEVHRAATVQPLTLPTSARPGSPSCGHVVAHTQSVDEPTADEERGAHERIDAETSRVETSEDETTTTTTLDALQITPLEEECAPQTSAAIDASARKLDHAETETKTDPARPSEDLADTTGDDEGHGMVR